MTTPVPIVEPTLDLTDPETFGRWYHDHWPAAVARAHHLTRDRTSAEDVAAEALLQAWSRWQVTGTPARPWPYVTATIHNLAVNHFRRADRERAHLAGLDPAPTPSPEDGVIDRELVRGLLPRLPDRERTAVVLHYLEDASSARVAQHLAVEPVTVRSHLHRARRRLAAPAA
jgi:RNA polymerase sigma-70 factor, ECF subfamily